jgi:hypothetical protein
MAAAGTGGPVAAAADEAAVGANGHLDQRADMRLAAAGGEGQATDDALTLLWGQGGRLVHGGKVVIMAAAMAGAAALLATAAAWRGRCRGGSGVGIGRGGGVGQGIGDVVRLATAAVETLLEQADFGFESEDALLEFPFALPPARVGVGADLGELCPEFGFPLQSALVEGLVEAGLLACLPEGLLTSGLVTRFSSGCGEGWGVHPREYARSADVGVGQ